MTTAGPGASSRRLWRFSGRSAGGYVKGVDELLAAISGRATTIYEFADGPVAYFAPEAPDFGEAGELKDDDLAAARRILEEKGESERHEAKALSHSHTMP